MNRIDGESDNRDAASDIRGRTPITSVVADNSDYTPLFGPTVGRHYRKSLNVSLWTFHVTSDQKELLNR